MDEDVTKATLLDTFESDLLTDLVPDPIAAVDVRASLSKGAVPPADHIELALIEVQLASRTDLLPIVDVATRAAFQALTASALSEVPSHPNVFGDWYGESTYQAAYARRRTRILQLTNDTSCRAVLKADIHNFAASVTLSALEAQTWMTDSLRVALRALWQLSGRCILHGHSWSNRLASALLSGVDEALDLAYPSRWLRWADDIHIFTDSRTEAEEARQLLSDALEPLGLRLSEAKTSITSPHAIATGVAADVSGEPELVWYDGLKHRDVRALRYALPRLAAQGNPAALSSLQDVIREWPYLGPRALMYLDRAASATDIREQVAAILAEHHAVSLITTRACALAIRHPKLINEISDGLLVQLEDSTGSGLVALAWRVRALQTGAPQRAPNERYETWLRSAASLDADPPVLDTLL